MAQTKNLGKVTVTPQGQYNASAEYERLDVVSYSGSSWMALQSVTGVTPSAGQYWMQIAQKGDEGDPGDPGDSITVDGIAAVGGNIELDALRYVEMSLTSSQQQTTRENIDAQETLTIDSAMSDVSTNPVQNNVIKAYIDAAMESAGGDAAPMIYDDATPADLVSVTDGANNKNFKSLVANITPVQSGSGDPSPDNIRPITGWTGANIYQSGADTSEYTTETISWQTEAGTVYGGTIDLVTGKLTVDRAMVNIPSIRCTKTTSTSSLGGSVFTKGLSNINPPMKPRSRYTPNTMLSDIFKAGDESLWFISNMQDYEVYANETNIYFAASNYADADSFNSAMEGHYLCYELATPIVYSLTPQDIKTLFGDNNVWADCGSIASMSYPCDTKLYIDEKTAALLAIMSEE